MEFTFEHTDDTSYSRKDVTVSEDATWMAALNEFVGFLEGVYGSGIKARIGIATLSHPDFQAYIPLRQHMLNEALVPSGRFDFSDPRELAEFLSL